MVNWQNPATISHEISALVKLLHVVDGIYIWEFICNLGFEWGLATGRRQWRWTVALYIATRLATVSDVMTELVGLNLTEEFNCKLWVHFVLFFRYATVSLSLSLYALRGIAIWQRSVPIAVLSGVLIIGNVGVWIRRLFQVNAVWVPAVETCMLVQTHPAIIANSLLLGTEVILLALMAIGIYRHNQGLRAFKVMYREGLLWLVAATLVEVVPVVFLALNLNDVMNEMFIAPSVLFTSIGSTRMYRSLSDRQSGNMLDFWETSRDETTGEIRFRRQTQFVTRTEGQADSASSTALPMGRLVRTQPQAEERFVERFEARDIELDDDSESMPDKKRPSEDDKVEPGWAHAK